MDIIAVLRLAVRALARNKMRSVLTMLGIIIGVAAVIASVAVGEGASSQIQQQISNLGDNMVWIEAGGRSVNGVRTGTRGTKRSCWPMPRPSSSKSPWSTTFRRTWICRCKSFYGNQNWYTTTRGVAPEFLPCAAWALREEPPFPRMTSITPRMSACWVRRWSRISWVPKIRSEKPFACKVCRAASSASLPPRDNRPPDRIKMT